jgi:hypothetical protein
MNKEEIEKLVDKIMAEVEDYDPFDPHFGVVYLRKELVALLQKELNINKKQKT